MNAIPGLNEKRRLTSVTQIRHDHHRAGRHNPVRDVLRAAAANNGYLDHLDAPYLLTVEFAGFDEAREGAATRQQKEKALKRVIPIKMTQRADGLSTTGGTAYTVDRRYPTTSSHTWTRYNCPRTSGSTSLQLASDTEHGGAGPRAHC